LTIGLQMDADQYLSGDKYDIEGPKNLFDAKLMNDWYLKIVADHPLVTYIEDGIRVGDNQGWQLHCAAMKEA
jgi:enolase